MPNGCDRAYDERHYDGGINYANVECVAYRRINCRVIVRSKGDAIHVVIINISRGAATIGARANADTIDVPAGTRRPLNAGKGSPPRPLINGVLRATRRRHLVLSHNRFGCPGS